MTTYLFLLCSAEFRDAFLFRPALGGLFSFQRFGLLQRIAHEKLGWLCLHSETHLFFLVPLCLFLDVLVVLLSDLPEFSLGFGPDRKLGQRVDEREHCSDEVGRVGGIRGGWRSQAQDDMFFALIGLQRLGGAFARLVGNLCCD